MDGSAHARRARPRRRSPRSRTGRKPPLLPHRRAQARSRPRSRGRRRQGSLYGASAQLLSGSTTAAVPYATISLIVVPISEESYCIRTTAFAPIAVAFWTIRSTACRRASSRSSVYSTISPPPSERNPAMMLPPRPRLRTTSPNTCPFISTIRCPETSSVVTTIISALLLRWLKPSQVLGDSSRLGAIADFELLDRRRYLTAHGSLRADVVRPRCYSEKCTIPRRYGQALSLGASRCQEVRFSNRRWLCLPVRWGSSDCFEAWGLLFLPRPRSRVG